MIDVKLILEKPEYVKAALAKKMWDFDPAPIQELSKRLLTHSPVSLLRFQNGMFPWFLH